MTRLNLSLDVGKGGPIQHDWRYFRATSGSISKSSILRHPEIALSKWTRVYIIYSCIYIYIIYIRIYIYHIYYEQETVSYSRSQLQVGRQNKCGRFRFVVLRGPWIGESLAYPGATTAPGAIFAWGNGCLSFWTGTKKLVKLRVWHFWAVHFWHSAFEYLSVINYVCSPLFRIF